MTITSGNPYVFVTGCARSGTTLLQRMMDNHGELAVTNDTRLIPASLFGTDAGKDLPLTEALVAEIVDYKWFGHVGIERGDAMRIAAEISTFAEFVAALLDEFARRRGKALAGEKVPQYVRRIPLIRRLFPDARVVHLIRDGREVALSTLDWVTPTRFLGRLPLWQEEPIAVCALWWHRQMSSAILARDQAGTGQWYHEVRYEHLAADADSTMRMLAEFLGLAHDPATVRFHEGRTVDNPKWSAKKRWLPPTSGLRDWRLNLPERDLQLFEVIAGDVLKALDYPLATGGNVPDDVVARAQYCRERWLAETMAVRTPAQRPGSRPADPAAC